METERLGIRAVGGRPHHDGAARRRGALVVLHRHGLRFWKLYQDDVIREAYFRADLNLAVLVLECADVSDAAEKLSELHLVSTGLIKFEPIPLVPYSDFSALFAG